MNTPLNVVQAGPPQGAPLLLIHGAWHGAWCWQGNYLEAFADAGFHAHALDLCGHGASPARRPMRWNRIRDYVDDAASVIAGMPAPPIVIGHSMGGFIAQHLMARGVPMRGVGLLAALPHTGALAVTLKTLWRTPLTLLRVIGTASLYPMVADPAAAAHLFLDPDADPETIAAFHARLTDESFMAFLGMIALALPRRPAASPPVCVVGGGLDQLFSPASQAGLARRFGTSAHIIADGPHDLMLSHSWRDGAQIFLDWARALPPVASPRGDRTRAGGAES